MAARLFFLTGCLSFLHVSSLFATHIRAGEITAELLSCQGYTYRFTITGYEDTESGVLFGERGTLSFGYGNEEITVTSEDFDRQYTTIGNEEVRITQFVIEHTFPAGGTYVVSYREENRNAEILNMAESRETAFYIETQLVIDPLFCNNTPILDSPPVDGAVIGRTFTHNPSAYDPDGDSLAYHLVIPKQDGDLEVYDYTYPDVYDLTRGTNPEPLRQDGSTPVTMTLDSITGLLTWDAPGNLGEYNIAFIVEEWRQVGGEWYRLGYVTRDMQIIVEDGVNQPPLVEVPSDTCVVAGTTLALPISATDPDGNEVFFQGFGEVFNLPGASAVITPDSTVKVPTPAEAIFNWTPQCEQIRLGAYQVNIKVTDVPSVRPPLVTYDLWNIQVVGPPVEDVEAALQGEDVLLRWNDYACATTAESVQIYRRIGAYPLPNDACLTGLPPEAGYTLVTSLSPDLVSFQDGASSEPLLPGVTYCYRLVATFPDGSQSIASDEVCVTTPSVAPYITHVDTEVTGTADGEIIVRWTEPLGIDIEQYPPPYSYTLLRSEGSSASFVPVAGPITTNTFEDRGLNTEAETYYYRVVGFDGEGQVMDTSAAASSVRLIAAAQSGQIQVSWQASVPWNNQSTDYPYHYIFRNESGETPDLLDSVLVTTDGFLYTDTQVDMSDGDKITYCYQVTTQGRYDSSLPIEAPLLNRSQTVCIAPYDTIPPCPVASVALAGESQDCDALLSGKPCDYEGWTNTLTWQINPEACSPDVAGVNVYFASSDTLGLEEYQLIAEQVTENSFIDGPLPLLSGCYRVRVVDQSGNESDWSEPVCQDNCPYFALPNIFTPNEDGFNEYFEALKEPFCPRFVRRVQLTVYNRWGKEVYFYDSEAQQARETSLSRFWDGRTSTGKKVSAGVYYYQGNVDFYELQPEPHIYKGWVQVMYEQPGTDTE